MSTQLSAEGLQIEQQASSPSGVSGSALLYTKGNVVYMNANNGGEVQLTPFDIDQLSALGGASLVEQQDHFVVSDNGTEKKILFEDVANSIFANVSGQAAIAASGSLSLDVSAITAQTEMTGDVADADELMISDGGVLKRLDFSVLRDAVFNDVSGDAAIADGGALTIATGAVEHAMLAVDCIDGDNIQDDVVNSEHLAAGAIDTEHIADDQVTLAKMAGLARGKFIYGDASGDPAALAAGADGKLLVADASGDPSWTTVSGDATLSAGALTLASAQTNVSSLKHDSLVVGRATGDDDITFSDDTIDLMTNNASRLKVQTANTTVSNNLIVAGNLTVQGSSVEVQQGFVVTASIQFEGSTPDGNELTLTTANPTADRTVTIPDLSGHVPLLAGAVSNANVSATEFALLDGDSSIGTTAVADGHGIFMNQGGTMGHTTVQTLAAYLDDEITAMPNLVQAGALNAGSITSGFGAIDVGTSNVSGGTLSGSVAVQGGAASFVTIAASGDCDFNGAADIAGDLTLNGGDGALTFAGANASIKVPDNSAAALVIEEANNAYMTFITTDSSEAVQLGVKLSLGAALEQSAGLAAHFGGGFSNGGVSIGELGSGLSINAADGLKIGGDGAGADAFFYGGAANELLKWDNADNRWEATDSNGDMIYTLGGDATGEYALDVSQGSNNINKIRASAFVTYSDRTLKKDIAPLEGSLEKVMKLDAVSYKMKSGNRDEIGFIAQEVAKVVPEVCALDANGEGRGIDYSRMSALLAGAVKSQQLQIEELKTIITKLQK
jgi:hypothetical protein